MTLRRTATTACGVAALLFQGYCLAGAPLEANDVCTADQPQPGNELVYPPLFPVYVMKAADGTYSTFEFPSKSEGVSALARSARSRNVSMEEAQSLCARGVNVKWLSASTDTPRAGVATKSTGYSPFPTTFAIAVINGSLVGNLYLNTGGGSWSGTTQWTTFLFSSSGYVGTREHAAVLLFFDDTTFVNSGQTGLNGNGITIGDLSGTSSLYGGCGNSGTASPYSGYPAYNTQMEAWWTGSDHIYPAGCLSTGMADSTWYNFDVQADIYDSVAYSRAGNSGYVNVNSDRSAFSKPLNTAAWSLGFGTTSFYSTSSTNFTLNFQSVSRGVF